MDWNIFFSTVSQTSGAIVGIFAAFLITRIIASQTDFNRNNERLTALLQSSQTLIEEADIGHFETYNAMVAEQQIYKLNEVFEKVPYLLTPAKYYDQLNFSPYQSQADSLYLINQEIIKLKKKRKKIVKKVIPGLGITGEITSPLSYPKIEIPPSFPDQFDIKNFIDNLLVRVSHQTQKNSSFLNEIKRGKETSNLVSGSIIAVLLLFFLGVVYPLSFLPISANSEIILSLSAFWTILFSLKGAILFLISTIFTGLMATFFVVNLRLKYDTEQIKELERYSQNANYSQYIRNYEKTLAKSEEGIESPFSPPQEIQNVS